MCVLTESTISDVLAIMGQHVWPTFILDTNSTICKQFSSLVNIFLIKQAFLYRAPILL